MTVSKVGAIALGIYFLNLLVVTYVTGGTAQAWADYGQGVAVATVAILVVLGGLPYWSVLVTAATVTCSFGLLTIGDSSSGPHSSSGGSHPWFVGFSACVLIAYVAGEDDWYRRPRLWVLGIVGATALYLSFSRTAFLALILATLLTLLLGKETSIFVRLAGLIGLLWAATEGVTSVVLRGLSDGDVQAFLSGTGRVEIWTRLLAVRSAYSDYGLGLAWSSSLNSRQSLVNAAAFGLPAENSALQAWITGGRLGLACWAVIFLLMLRKLWSFGEKSLPRITLFCAVALFSMTTIGFAGTGFCNYIIASVVFGRDWLQARSRADA